MQVFVLTNDQTANAAYLEDGKGQPAVITLGVFRSLLRAQQWARYCVAQAHQVLDIHFNDETDINWEPTSSKLWEMTTNFEVLDGDQFRIETFEMVTTD